MLSGSRCKAGLMVYARVLLAITGIVFAVHGVVCFIHPDTIGLESGLAMPTPASIIEVRAEYGGLPFALGLFFFAGAARALPIRTALVVLVTVVTGYAVARILAAAIAGEIDFYNSIAILYEVTTAVLGFLALQATQSR